MKKSILLLFLSVFFFYNNSYSQSLKFEKADSLVKGTPFEKLESFFTVKNISNYSISFNASLHTLQIAPGHKFSLCFGNCGGELNETFKDYTANRTISLLSGQSLTFIIADLYPYQNEGTSIINYIFWNTNDSLDNIQQTITFIAQNETQVENFNIINDIIEISPNPAIDFIKIKFNDLKYTEIKIINEIGAEVYSNNKFSNFLEIETNNLQNDIYYCILINKSKFLKKKFIVLK